MAQQWKVESPSYSYTFPETFEMREYSGEAQLASRPQHGNPGGEVTAGGRHRRQVRQFEIYGFVQEASTTLTLEELQRARAAFEDTDEEIYLVNTVDDIRIPVRLNRALMPLQMVSTARCSFFFRSTTQTYWEARTLSRTTTTLKHWHDHDESGDIDILPDFEYAGPVTNPMTAVQGNWNWKVNMKDSKATTLNTRAGVALWGEVDAVVESQTTGGAGGSFGSGAFMTFFTMPDHSDPSLHTLYRPPTHQRQQTTRINRWQLHWSVDVKPSVNSTAPGTMWVWQSSNPTPMGIYWSGNIGKWFFTDGAGNLASAVDSFSTPFSWINLQGHASAGATVKSNRQMNIFVDNVQTTGALTWTPANPGTKIWIGSNRASLEVFEGNIREIAFWDKPINTQQTISNIASGIPPDSDQSPLIYFPIDSGVQTKSLGSERFRYMDVTGVAAGGQTLTIRGNADNIFRADEWVLLEDRTGYGAWGVLATVQPTTMIFKTRGGTPIATVIDVGSAINFEASAKRYFRAPLTTTNDITTGDIGLAFQIRTTSSGTARTVAAKRGPSGAGWWLYVTTVGSINLLVEDDAANVDIMRSTQTINGGDWHQVIVLVDRAANYDFFIDGTEKGQIAVPISNGDLGNATAFCIASRSEGTLYFEGELRDFHFWGNTTNAWFSTTDTKRDQARLQVALLMQTFDWRNAQNENAMYKMTEVDNTPLQDFTGNSRTLTATGGTPVRIQRPIISDDLISDAFCDYRGLGEWRITLGDPLGRVKEQDAGQVWRSPDHLGTFLAWDEEYSHRMELEAGKSYFVDYMFKSTGNRVQIRDITKGNVILGTTLNMQGLGNSLLHRRGFVFTLPATPIGVHHCDMVLDSHLSGPSSSFPFDLFGIHVHECFTANMNETTTGWTQVGSPLLFFASTNEQSGTKSLGMELDAANEGGQHTVVLPQNTVWLESTFALEGDAGAEEITYRLSGFGGELNTPASRDRQATTQWQTMRMINKSGVGTLGTIVIIGENGITFRIDDLALFERGPVDVETNVVAAGAAAFPNLVPSKYGWGRNFDGGLFSVTSMLGRPDRFGVIARVRMNTVSTTISRVIFEMGKGTSSLASHFYNLQYDGTNQKWIFGSGINTISGPATSEVIGKDVEVGMMVISDGSVNKALLYEDGAIIKSTQTFTAAIPTLTHLQIGTDRDEANSAKMVIDDLAGLHQYPGDSFFEGIAKAQKPIIVDNQILTWASAMPTSDTLLLFGTKHQIIRLNDIDETNPTIIDQQTEHNAAFLQFARGSAFSHTRNDTIFTNQRVTQTAILRPRFN